jgi:DNA-binding XRE family transcriptional regulator
MSATREPTNYERAMAEADAALTPAERALDAAIDADFSFAVEVILLRKALGISQSELAARTGVPQPELSRIEAGKTSPTLGRAQRILGGLGSGLRVRPSTAVGYSMSESAPAKSRQRAESR